jgi:PAS domain S-box-containing protein
MTNADHHQAEPREGNFDWLRKIARILPVGIYCCDPQGRCLFVNERWCELTGLSAEQALGDGWMQAIHPEDREKVCEKWRRIPELDEHFRWEYRYLRSDGAVVWAHGELAKEYDDDGQLIELIGCVTDISELQGAREELQRAREELEARMSERTRQLHETAMVIDQTDDAVIRSDLAGRIVDWNQGAEKLLGYTRAEVLGGSTLAITPEQDQAAAIMVKQRVRQGEAIHHREVVRLRKGGERVPVLLSVFPLRDEAGVIVGSTAILRDLTEQKKAEHRLRQLSQRLLSAQDEERRRIARELHDSTAQLLVALSINLGRVCMEGDSLDAEKRAELLAESCLLADRATQEIRTQSYLLHPPMIEERGLVAALRFFLDGFTERSGIEVEFHAPRHLRRQDPAVELTLFRIVQESLANVLRHSQSTQVEVVLTVESGWLDLTVRDFGCGLPADPEELRGVGIAGMRERVAQMGGSFDLESAAPGVKVRVRLPATPPYENTHPARR